MCVAIVVPAGKDIPTPETLQLCADANPHGGGIAWIQDGAVQWRKGLEVGDVIAIAGQVTAPMFIHFRIASTGGVCSELCHPFPLERRVRLDTDGSSRGVLMHNGHWHDWREMLQRYMLRGFPEGPWSDTRALTYLATQFGDGFLEVTREKVAILRPTGITMFGDWPKEENGVYFSNYGWKVHEAWVGTTVDKRQHGKRGRHYDTSTHGWDWMDEKTPPVALDSVEGLLLEDSVMDDAAIQRLLDLEDAKR
jgi:hypothetical protein